MTKSIPTYLFSFYHFELSHALAFDVQHAARVPSLVAIHVSTLEITQDPRVVHISNYSQFVDKQYLCFAIMSTYFYTDVKVS